MSNESHQTSATNHSVGELCLCVEQEADHDGEWHMSSGLLKLQLTLLDVFRVKPASAATAHCRQTYFRSARHLLPFAVLDHLLYLTFDRIKVERCRGLHGRELDRRFRQPPDE